MNSAIEELAANVAFIHRKAGIGGFREFIDLIATERSSAASYELMQSVVEELKSTGLLSAANDLEQVAQILPHEWELPCKLPPDCPDLIEQWREEMTAKKQEYENSLQKG